MSAPRCAVCGVELEHGRRFQRVSDGYVERGRSAGGSNALRAPVLLDEWGCRLCVDEIAAGHRSRPGAAVPWEQERLF